MKGTYSQGQHNKAGSHIICRRCGKHAFHKNRKICASCGYGNTARIRKYAWQVK
jgi:large subunit ribosomal protein L37e